MESDLDDSFSPFTLRKCKNPMAYRSPHPSKKEVGAKLSLKKNASRKVEESNDLLKTPVAGSSSASRPISAAFLFSSCKKKSPEKGKKKEPSILLADSSEEESFYQEAAEESWNENDPVQDSLEEYSLIRRWLQNADSSDESDNSFKDSSPPAKSPSFYCSTTNKENKLFSFDSDLEEVLKIDIKSEEKTIISKDIEEIVILSSDDDDDPFDKYLQNTQMKGKIKSPEPEKPAGSSFINDSNVIEDSFDSTFVMKSLRERMKELDANLEPLINKTGHFNDISIGCSPKWRTNEPNANTDDKTRKSSQKMITGNVISLASDSDSDDVDIKKTKNVKIVTGKPNRKLKASKNLPKASSDRLINLSDSDSDSDAILLTRTNPKTAKTPKSCKNRPKATYRTGNDSELEDIFTGMSIVDQVRDTKPGKASFLASLSASVAHDKRHPEAVDYVKSFRKLRDHLTHRLFKLFNEKVFDGRLPRDFSVTWNARLTRTAGYCRHFTRRENGAVTFESRIELSVKVLDAPCRLRDTLIHEMCHAATWMIDNCRGGHGPMWRKWADLARRVFPELPAITRCHNYEISCKFYYNCTRCRYSIGRHSKSIDTTTQVCPLCRGNLQLAKEPHPKNQENQVPSEAMVQRTPRTPNAFALFVKEHFAATRSSRPDLPHASIMKLLSSKFAESKQQKN